MFKDITQQRCNSYLIGALMLIVLIFRFPVPVGLIRLSMLALFESAVTIILAINIFKYNKYLAGFAILALISKYYPVPGRLSYLAFDVILFGLIFYYFCYAIENTNIIFNFICVFCFINLTFQVLQYFDINILMKPLTENWRCPGLLSNVNETSAAYAFSFPVFLRPKWIWWLPALIIGFFLAGSSGGILAAAIGAVLFILFRSNGSKTFYSILAGIIAVVVIYSIIDPPGFPTSRVEVATIGLEKVSKHWLLGAGIGHWKVLFSRPEIIYRLTNPLRYTYAHNEYLQMFFEMGIFFVLLVIGYAVSTVLKIIRSVKTDDIVLGTCAVLIIALNSLYNFPFHVAPTAMLAIFWIALLDRSLNEYRQGIH